MPAERGRSGTARATQTLPESTLLPYKDKLVKAQIWQVNVHEKHRKL